MSSSVKSFDERRQSRRIDMEEADAVVTWQEPKGKEQQLAGYCLDLSRQGALLEVSAPLEEGQMVSLILNPNTEAENKLTAQIKRVQFMRPDHYHIGLELVQ